MKQMVFLSGLPRSGSTLFANILAQNPALHATATSGVVEMMVRVRNQWSQIPEFKASPDVEMRRGALRGFLQGCYAHREETIIIDKHRGWPSHIEMLEVILDQPVRIVLCMRDVRDVLASCEKIWRSNKGLAQTPQEGADPLAFQTLEGRCAHLLKPDQMVGSAIRVVQDAYQRGHAPSMHIIDYTALTQEPEKTLTDFYGFIGADDFDHDFGSVAQTVTENDEVWGIRGLHSIRPKVEPQLPQWPKILGRELGKRHAHWNQRMAHQTAESTAMAAD